MWATRYRPSNLAEVVGQEWSKKIIRGRLLKGGKSNTWLIVGPWGSGKTTLVRIIAKALTCLNPTNLGEACYECQSCKAIDNDSSPNYSEYDAASHGKVEQVRELIQDSNSAPMGESPNRVIALDEAQMLTSQSQNALLKTCEQTPATTHFILITTDPQKLIPTIRSRALKLELTPVPQKEVVNLLMKICLLEGVDFEEKALELIVGYKYGHVRDALTLAETISLAGSISVEAIKCYLHLDLDEYSADLLMKLNGDWENLYTQVEVLMQESSSEELWGSILRVIKQAQLLNIAPTRVVSNEKIRQLEQVYPGKFVNLVEWVMKEAERFYVRTEADLVLGLSVIRDKLGLGQKSELVTTSVSRAGEPIRVRVKNDEVVQTDDFMHRLKLKEV